MRNAARPDVAHAVIEMMARHLETHPSFVRHHHDLGRDWGLDVFDLVLMAVELEETLNIALPTATLGSVTTVGELIGIVRACSLTGQTSRDDGPQGQVRAARAASRSRCRRAVQRALARDSGCASPPRSGRTGRSLRARRA